MDFDQQKKHEEVQKRIIAEILDNNEYLTFFEQYQEDSVLPFVTKYAEHKANLVVYGDFTKFCRRDIMGHWQHLAWHCLSEIQHKKLFDLSCQWNAELVTDLPEIKVLNDFILVSHHVLDYPAITDISEEELQFYIRYMKSLEPDITFVTPSEYDYHDQSEIKARYSEEQVTDIEYYDYHNIYTGNHTLLHLPNIREEKEREYIRLVHQDNFEKSGRADTNLTPQKPHLFDMEEDLIAFAERFEDFKTASFIKDYSDWLDITDDMHTEFAIRYLSDVLPERVPISANLSWQEAICFSATAHQRSKVIELLPSIYEEYLMKKSIGVSLTNNENLIEHAGNEDWIRELVLQGRRLKGEPEDFDF
jgi:hypothetical protein